MLGNQRYFESLRNDVFNCEIEAKEILKPLLEYSYYNITIYLIPETTKISNIFVDLPIYRGHIVLELSPNFNMKSWMVCRTIMTEFIDDEKTCESLEFLGRNYLKNKLVCFVDKSDLIQLFKDYVNQHGVGSGKPSA